MKYNMYICVGRPRIKNKAKTTKGNEKLKLKLWNGHVQSWAEIESGESESKNKNLLMI